MAMNSNQQLRSGVFIDGSNVMWGSLTVSKEKRWLIDFAKLKTYLDKEYKPLFVKYYGIEDMKPREARFKTRAKFMTHIYRKLTQLGYELITKPLKYIRLQDGRFTTKGDMDVEITMGIMDNMDTLDRIILISGDSDYLPLIERMHNKSKQIIIIAFDKLLAWELRTFTQNNKNCKYTKIESIRGQIELK